MTNPDYTGLLLIIDRSGSMATIRDDMVGGLEAMLRDQAAEPGRLSVDIVTFDTEIETQSKFADPASVVIALEPRGATALYDAIGYAVSTYGWRLALLPEVDRPGRVQVVVATDGEENSSHEWTADAVRTIVERQTSEFGWDFVFLGANQDAVLTGGRLGFQPDKSMTWEAAPEGVAGLSAGLNGYLKLSRAGADVAFTATQRKAAKGQK
jgi:uncharacterized protein YegL